MLPALIFLWIVLFLILLLSLPIRVRARAELSLRAGRIQAQATLLGFLKIPINLKIHLFSEPTFTLRWRKKAFPLLRRRVGPPKPTFVPAFTIDQLNFTYILGIADDAAATVWALGGLKLLSDAAAKVLDLPLRLSLRPVFDADAFRIILDGMITIRLVNSIHNYLIKRRSAHASR